MLIWWPIVQKRQSIEISLCSVFLMLWLAFVQKVIIVSSGITLTLVLLMLMMESYTSHKSHKIRYKSSLWAPEVAMDPECRSRLQQDSAFFFRTLTRIRSKKCVNNRTRIRSHFSISAAAGVCAVVSWARTWGGSRFDRWSPASEEGSDSQILKNFWSGPGFKHFGAESESEKVTPSTCDEHLNNGTATFSFVPFKT